MRLPTGLEYEEPRVRGDADDSLAIVGDGGDHARHFSPMPVAPKLRVIRVHEIDGGGNAAEQIRMLCVNARIDDRNLDALASRPGMRIRDIHLLKTALQTDIRVVVALGARGKGLQGLRQLDAPVLRQRGEQLTAIGARRYLQNGAMNLQRSDRPRIDLAQAVLAFHGMQSFARTSGRTVVRDCIVAARRAASIRNIGRGHIVHRHNNVAVRGQRCLIAERSRIAAHGRAAATARQCNCGAEHNAADHGESPGSGSGKVPSAKRTVECWRSSAKDARTVSVEFEASEYTPASVGPETILSCASWRRVCNYTRVILGAKTA